MFEEQLIGLYGLNGTNARMIENEVRKSPRVSSCETFYAKGRHWIIFLCQSKTLDYILSVIGSHQEVLSKEVSLFDTRLYPCLKKNHFSCCMENRL